MVFELKKIRFEKINPCEVNRSIQSDFQKMSRKFIFAPRFDIEVTFLEPIKIGMITFPLYKNETMSSSSFLI